MKKLFFTLIALLFLTYAHSQKWEQTIGIPNLSTLSNRGIEHYDKGYILTGVHTSGYRDAHGWVVKTDINGNVLWDKSFGLNPDQVILDITQFDAQGNMYMFGTMKQDIEGDWPLLVKLNACGEKEWCKYYGFTEEFKYGFFTDAIVLKNGDLLGLAYMVKEEGHHDRVLLYCVSPDGVLKWKKSYASCVNYPQFEDRFGRRIQQFDDIFIISGYVNSPHPNFPNICSLRPMYIGIDTLFNEKWVLEFGLEDNMKGKAHTSIPINDSLFMGVGRYRYSDSTGMTMDAWAMFYNDKGQQTGYKRITRDKLGPEVKASTFYEIERIDGEKYLAAAGYIYGEDGDSMGEIIFDTAGNVYNYTIREQVNAGPCITKTFDNKYAISSSRHHPNSNWDMLLYKINQNLEHDTLYPGNYTYDSLCTELPIQSSVIDMAGCDVITSIGEVPTLEEYNKNLQSIPIKASPNPTNTGEVLLEMENTGLFSNMQLKVYDVFGKQTHSEKVYPHQGATRLDVSNWPGGMYVVIIYTNGQVRGKCKVVVE